MTLISEIQEQPSVLARQLQNQKDNILHIAEEIRRIDPSYISFVARGTSAHAGIYAQYLLGIENGLPFSMVAPSMATCYGRFPKMKHALAIGVSQSGKSPDLVAAISECKQQSLPVLIIANTPDSPLGHQADYLIDCMAGPEKATAATKSYTTSLMAFAMLSAALSGDPARWHELEQIPTWAEQALQLEQSVAALAQRYVYAQRCVVLGRGLNYATAKEWGLKIQELTYMMAEPYSNADFQHGPIAMVEHGFPVLSVACQGKVLNSILPQLESITKKLSGNLLAITNSDEVVALAQHSIQLSADIPEWLFPIISIIPAQLFACHLCAARGYDTETPRTIAKVTETH